MVETLPLWLQIFLGFFLMVDVVALLVYACFAYRKELKLRAERNKLLKEIRDDLKEIKNKGGDQTPKEK